jgi:hypothetical protein
VAPDDPSHHLNREHYHRNDPGFFKTKHKPIVFHLKSDAHFKRDVILVLVHLRTSFHPKADRRCEGGSEGTSKNLFHHGNMMSRRRCAISQIRVP